MKRNCHACGEKIARGAKVCRHCGASQEKIVYLFNTFSNIATLFISILALIVSISALYFSRIKEPASPRVIVQIDNFRDDSFSFFAANLGELPTIIRSVELEITLQHGTGEHALKAFFQIEPTEMQPNENRYIEVPYSQFDPRFTKWIESEDSKNPFDRGFLFVSAALGGNLHCEVSVNFLSLRYFPSNTDGAGGSVNGTCPTAMNWFAKKIGPSQADGSTK